MPQKEPLYVSEKQLINRFINYYILKFLWLKHGNYLKELYEKLNFFNRTRYDRILRLDEFNIDPKVSNLDKSTGISLNYLRGEDYIQVPGLQYEDWREYTKLREKRRKTGQKSTRQIELENKIHDKLIIATKNRDKRSASFITVNHFALHQRPQDMDLQNEKVKQVTELIDQFTESNLKTLAEGILSNYEDALIKHLEVVHAILVLKKLN